MSVIITEAAAATCVTAVVGGAVGDVVALPWTITKRRACLVDLRTHRSFGLSEFEKSFEAAPGELVGDAVDREHHLERGVNRRPRLIRNAESSCDALEGIKAES